jgi:hypothetical protein
VSPGLQNILKWVLWFVTCMAYFGTLNCCACHLLLDTYLGLSLYYKWMGKSLGIEKEYTNIFTLMSVSLFTPDRIRMFA